MTLVADCSRSVLTQIPNTLPYDTDWLILSGNKISSLGEETLNISVLNHISKLDLRANIIDTISSEFMDKFVKSGKRLFLDISMNKLRHLPEALQNVTSLEKLVISNNDFQCSCDEVWMKDWLLNNSKIVDSYGSIKCQMQSGRWIAIIQMNEVDLGCIPNPGSFQVWKIIGIDLIIAQEIMHY